MQNLEFYEVIGLSCIYNRRICLLETWSPPLRMLKELTKINRVPRQVHEIRNLMHVNCEEQER